jgi:macrolide transport system ATP-binding/permease protein
MNSIISLRKISKTYFQGSQKIEVLKQLNLEIESNECVAILGQSGSGKSTLLSLLAGLDNPEIGTCFNWRSGFS